MDKKHRTGNEKGKGGRLVGSFRPFPTSRQFGKSPNSRTKINLSNRHLKFLLFRHHIRTNNVALFSAYRHAHNPQFLHSF